MRLIFLFILLQFFALEASADFDTAMALYQKKDYEQAMTEFMHLAEIGDHASQFNVGIMNFRGEGVPKDPVKAYAWMALASQDGEENWTKARDKALSSLTNEQKRLAESARNAMFQRLSDAALEQQLQARLLPRRSARYAKLTKAPPAEYPRFLVKRGEGGWVDLSFTIAADGTTRNHSILFSTNPRFAETVLNNLKGWRYEPRLLNGTPSDVYGDRFRYTFRIWGAEADKPKLEALVKELREKAEHGNAIEIYNAATTLRKR